MEKELKQFTADTDLIGAKIKPTTKPAPEIGIDLNDNLYKNILQAGQASALDINTLTNFTSLSQKRDVMYNLIDSMAQDSTVSSALEIYTEDATEYADNGRIVWAESDISEVSKYIQYLIDTLNIDKNIYKWVYSLIKYGDLYVRLYRESDVEDNIFANNSNAGDKKLNESHDAKSSDNLDEAFNIYAYNKDDKYTHYVEMISNPAEMFELTKYGKTAGFIRANISSMTSQNDDNLFFNTMRYSFKSNDIDLFQPTEFVHATLDDKANRIPETVEIIRPATAESSESKYEYRVRRGSSILQDHFKVWRELTLLENSVMLNRVTRSSIVRMINVEVGDMPPEDVQFRLLEIKKLFEQKAALNENSNMSEYTNPGPVENNVYIPTNNGVGAITTAELGGDADVKGLADLDYFKNKWYAGIRIPKQYLGDTDDAAGFSGGQSLSIISSRYAKTVKRIQQAIIQMLTDLINLMLIDKKLDSYVNKFTIKMLAPTTQEEIDRRDNEASKIQITRDILDIIDSLDSNPDKAKIGKLLLSNIISDPEIISILDDAIAKYESEEEEDTEETEKQESTDNFEFNDDSFTDADLDAGEFIEPPSASKDELEAAEEDDVLPSPSDLDVDMTDNN